MNTDTLSRDDMKKSATPDFDALSPEMRKALVRAATRPGCVINLPGGLTDGWMMVPTKKGLRQVAFSSTRAWSLH